MPKKKFSAAERQFLRRRAHFRCEYCLTPEIVSPVLFEIDHIIPLSKGGTSEPENLALACGGCNAHKHFHTQWADPKTGRQSRLFHPRLNQWTDHFEWSQSLLFVIGKTPSGRATLELLQLNRPTLLNLRAILAEFGLHPAQTAI